MNFGEAITLLNAGHPVTRSGWNGKGMFLIRAGGYKVEADKVKPNGIITTEFLERRGLTHLEILPHIDMWTVNASGRQAYLAGWLASQSDMLADDWMIYEESTIEPTWQEVADIAEAEFEKELEKVTGIKKSMFAYKPLKNPAPHGYKKDGTPKKKPGRKL